MVHRWLLFTDPENDVRKRSNHSIGGESKKMNVKNTFF